MLCPKPMGSRRACGIALLVLVACGDRRDDPKPSGGAGNGAAGGSTLSSSGSGGASAGPKAGSGGTNNTEGNAGTRASAGTGGSAATCREREQQAAEAVAEALESVDLSCRDDADCKLVSIDCDCHAACGALVGRGGEATVQAAIAAQNAGVCAGFERDGCSRL